MSARYIPQLFGAKCDSCVLNGRALVAPEIRPRAKLLVIGDPPAAQEETKGQLFAGAAGTELDRALAEHGISRTDVSITAPFICRAPGTLTTEERKAVAECCAPRFHAEITEAKALLALGNAAFEAVSTYSAALRELTEDKVDFDPSDDEDENEDDFGRGSAGLFKLRGFPLQAGGKPLLVSFHPNHVLHARRWTSTFRWDVGKALRHAANALEWKTPEIILDPTPEGLDNVLARLEATGRRIVQDVETTYEHVRLAKLRCIGIGVAELVVVVYFNALQVDPQTFRCPAPVVRERLNNFNRRVRIAGHNFNSFDRTIYDRYGLFLPPFEDVVDTLAADHVVDSELPHGLDYLSSRHTDAPKHKPGGKDHWKKNSELGIYCAYDVATNATIGPEIMRRMIDTDQVDAYKSDIKFQRVAQGMMNAGMFIDITEREKHRVRLTEAKKLAEERAEAAAGRRVAMGSPHAIRAYLFDEKGLAWPSIETDSGLPSTGRDAIFELQTRALPDDVSNWLDRGLIRWRWADKKLGFVKAFEPDPSTGRLYPQWNALATVVGRPAARKPAVGTVPGLKDDTSSLRSCFAAAPGNILVAADLAQVHLRIIAAAAGIQPWIETFKNNSLDLHRRNAAFFFDKPESSIEKFERSFSKTLIYLLVYAGGVDTAVANMRKVRDPKTWARPYRDISRDTVETMRDNLLKRIPELERWWETKIRQFKQQRYIASWILRRRRYFRDIDGGDVKSEERSEVINYEILSTEADWMGGAGAAGKFIDLLPFNLYGPGLIHHGYDSLLVEVDKRHAGRVRSALRESMTGEIRGVPIDIDLHEGPSWAALS